MRNDIDIIYFTLFPWDNTYSSVSLSFTKEFAKNNRIFYVNHPYSVKDFISNFQDERVQKRKWDLLANKMRYEEVPSIPDNVIAMHPPLTVPTNFLPDGNLYNQLARYNHKKVLKSIKKMIDDYQLKNYIFLNCFNPYFASLLPRSEFQPLLNIYQCIDDMTQETYTAKHGARLEEEVIRQADLAFVTSKNLWKIKSHLNPNLHVLHNAVDITIFQDAVEKEFERPHEIADVKTKIIGFMGNLDPHRINYDLLKKIALKHNDKTLLLIGPLNNNQYKEVGLDTMPNVIFTGGKNIKELPAYLQHMDCTIIPFLCNKLTESIYPLKINEYLAAGKPVISSNFSIDIQGFKDVIYLADDDDLFLQYIDKAIAEDDDQKLIERTEVAHSNTWTARVNQFWDIVEKHLVNTVS